MGTCRKIFVLAILALLPVTADNAYAAGRQSANPALWRIESATGKAYILGSYHILRRGIVWATPPLVTAMSEADEFIFEAELGEDRMAEAQEYIDTTGYLPEGQTLRTMLSPEGLATYQQIVRRLPLDIREMDKLRP